MAEDDSIVVCSPPMTDDKSRLQKYKWLGNNAAYCATSSTYSSPQNQVTSCEIVKFKDRLGNTRYEINFYDALKYATHIRTDRIGLQKLLRELQLFLLIKD